MVSIKRLFGVSVFLAAFLLVSCGQGFSGKKGSLSFEIPVTDIVMSREGENTSSYSGKSGQNEYYHLLVQIKGNGGYSAAQVKTVSVQEIYQAMAAETQKKTKEGIQNSGVDYSELMAALGGMSPEQLSGMSQQELMALIAATSTNGTGSLTPEQIAKLAQYSDEELDAMSDEEIFELLYGISYEDFEKMSDDEKAAFVAAMTPSGTSTGTDVSSSTQTTPSEDESEYDYIPKKYLNYSFTDLPADQTYVVMVDIFFEVVDTYGSSSYLMVTGEKENVVVYEGQTTSITVDAKKIKESYGYSLFDMKIDYLDGETEETQAITVNSVETWAENAMSPNFYVGYCEDEEGTFYYSTKLPEKADEYSIKYENQSHEDWKKITDLSYTLKKGSHFEDFVFASITYENDDEGKQVEKSNPLVFTDGAWSAKDNLDTLSLLSYLKVSKRIGNKIFSFNCSLPHISQQYLIEFKTEESSNTSQEGTDPTDTDPTDTDPTDTDPTDTDPTDTDPTDTETTIQNEVHGSLIDIEENTSTTTTTTQLSFERRNDSSRFIYEVPLSNILSGKTLSNDDTVVFVVKVPVGDTSALPFTQFYYQLQVSDWADMDDRELYNGNNCINCGDYPAQNGERTFVLPLNFVQNTNTYNTLLLYFDSENGQDNIINFTVSSFEYYIFPAKTKTFVFGIGTNYGDESHPYRYEFKLPLVENNVPCDFEGNETVEVTLSGEVLLYQVENEVLSGTVYSTNTNTLNGEIFDGAEYSSKKSEWRYFHPLSNTEDKDLNNVLALKVKDGSFDSGNTYRFESIQTPFFDKAEGTTIADDFTHNYQFQCTTPCDNPSALLVIQGFSMETEVTPGD